MEIAIRNIGNSKGVVLTKALLAQAGLDGESVADVSVENGAIVIRKAERIPEGMEVAICSNPAKWQEASSLGLWAGTAFHAALFRLRPTKGEQVVDFAGLAKEAQHLKGAELLVEAGILKRVAGSKSRFSVPRSVAYAKLEPTIKTLLEKK